jgi:hypothetical protein
VLFESASFNELYPAELELSFVDSSPSRTLRREPALTQFETAQIANLCPADSEEAKSVIPR